MKSPKTDLIDEKYSDWMEWTVYKVLGLLRSREHDFEGLRLKVNLPSNQLQALLEWGMALNLWFKDPISESYLIGDTGELVLRGEKVQDILKVHSLALPEPEAEEPSLLKEPELLRRIREVMDKEIVGEYVNKLLLFMIFLSKELGPQEAQACFIMGESSSGKSYLMHHVLSYFPEERVIWLTRSTTHGLEYFCKDKDLTGHILAIEEAPGFRDAQASIRPIFSEKGLKIVTAQALGGGKVVSEVLEIKGCPAFVTTSVSPVIDEQMSTRVWILSTDESQEQTKRILKHEARKGKFPEQAGMEEKRAIMEALKELKPVKVLIPYADAIEFPSKKVRVRRDFPKLLTLIKVSAYLHQYQRPRIVLDGKEYVVATFSDYHIAHTLASKVLRPTLLGLPRGVLRVYDVCKKLSQDSEEITSRSVTEGCDYSQSTVRKYLEQLVRARLLLKDESQREHRFSLIGEEEMGLNGIPVLEQKFGKKELEEWSRSIRAHGIEYEDLRGFVYNPIPNSHSASGVEERSPSPEKEKEMGFALNPILERDRRIDEVFKSLEKNSGELVPLKDVTKRLHFLGIKNPERLIEKLKSEGVLFEPRKGFLKRV